MLKIPVVFSEDTAAAECSGFNFITQTILCAKLFPLGFQQVHWAKTIQLNSQLLSYEKLPIRTPGEKAAEAGKKAVTQKR